MIRFAYAADHDLLYIKISDVPAAETVEMRRSTWI